MVIKSANKHYPINAKEVKFYEVDDKKVSVLYRNQGTIDIISFPTPEDAQKFVQEMDNAFEKYFGR